MNWQKYRIGDVLKVTHGFAFKGEFFANSGNNVLLTPGNFRPEGGIKFDWGKQKFYRGEFPESFVLSEGDILLAMTDLTPGCAILGAPLKIRDSKYRYLHNQRLGKVVVQRPDLIHADYFYYYCCLPAFRNQVIGSKTGTTVSHTAPERIYRIEIALPPLPIQRRIADILGALDDKIECNRRINQTLEAIAQALYKHWFVDFAPFRDGEFLDSELGEIPSGWQVKPIGEVVETLGGGTPNTSNPAYWENGEINWYVPSDLTGAKTLFITESSKKINRKGLAGSAARIFPARSVMMTSRATIGEIAVNRAEACTNQGFIAIIPNEQISLYQIVFWLHQNMEKIQGMAHGTTFKEITRGTFRTFPILIAKDADVYVRQSKALFDQIESNIVESAILTRTRDYLLPKLLSGEINVG